MTDFSVQSFNGDGTELSFTSVDGGTFANSFANNGRVMLYVKNNDSNSTTVKFKFTGTVDGQSVTNKSFTLSANTDGIYGPFERQYYNNSNGDVEVEFTNTTSVTAAAIQPNEFTPLSK